MMRAKYLFIVTVVLSAIIMFTSCQEEPTSVEPQDATQQGLSKFSIPDGATYVSATFNIHLWQWGGYGVREKDVNLHRITEPWEEMVVTYNSFDTSYVLSEIEGSFHAAAIGWYSADVTALVGNWMDGTHPNYGLLLDHVPDNPRAVFNSRESTYGNHPYLEICYILNGVTVCEQIEPLGDATIFQEKPDVNFGADQSLYVGWWGYSPYDKQAIVMFDLEPTPPEPDCETAYAFGDNLATCFLDIPEANSNNWGWSNGPISDPSSYSWDIYAGAGQCDITKGTLVGTLDVDYSGGTVTVAYNIDTDFTLDETHLYVGNEILARDKNGNYTTAPGQYPYSGEASYTIDGLSGDIYVVAHSVVCGDYD